ncbi:MAG: beta-lactamase family protein, partial [Schleiferiaceae bacterium]|nr:beta-lactamase family protein [Schleiferiaceae bacterium]
MFGLYPLLLKFIDAFLGIFRVTFLFFWLSLLFSCNQKSEQVSIAQTELRLRVLDSTLQYINQSNPITGFSVAVTSADSAYFIDGFGLANVEDQVSYTSKTTQPIASVSKTFIGVSIMMLVDQGKLNLDETVNSILPYSLVNPHHPEKEIRVRHLVTHTSGLTDDYEDENGSVYWLLEEWDSIDYQTSPDLITRLAYFE